MFERDFYVSLVNAEFAKQLKTPVDVAMLNAKEPRALRAIDAWLAKNPLQFRLLRPLPARPLFLGDAAGLSPQVSDAAEDRFEAAFKYLNALLK